MKKEFVRNPYNYDSDALSEQTGLKCLDESLTEQEHTEEADINYIADRYMRTGMAPQVLHLPTPGDFEGIFDFQTAMNTITQAKQEFMNLPAKIRSRFANDPAQMLAFVNDNENRDEAEKLGLLTKRENSETLQSPLTKGDTNESRTRTDTQEPAQTQTRHTRTKANLDPDA